MNDILFSLPAYPGQHLSTHRIFSGQTLTVIEIGEQLPDRHWLLPHLLTLLQDPRNTLAPRGHTYCGRNSNTQVVTVSACQAIALCLDAP